MHDYPLCELHHIMYNSGIRNNNKCFQSSDNKGSKIKAPSQHHPNPPPEQTDEALLIKPPTAKSTSKLNAKIILLI